MSLSLELCRELKAAGAPQDKTEWIWIIFPDPPIGTGGARQVLRANWDFRQGNEWVADWNSDELIAQIQAEWPDTGICLVGPNTHLKPEKLWHAETCEWEGDETIDAWAPSPAEALARLYIALMEAK